MSDKGRDSYEGFFFHDKKMQKKNENDINFIRQIKIRIINYRKTIVHQLHQLSVGYVYQF